MKMKLSSLLIHTSPLTARQERTSLLFCWGPGVGVTGPQTDGSRLGTPLTPSLRGFGLQAELSSGGEAPGAGHGDASTGHEGHGQARPGHQMGGKAGWQIGKAKGLQPRLRKVPAPVLQGLARV